MEVINTKKDLYCVICGELKNNSYYSLCGACTPFIYKKGRFPHQKARYRKKWKENRAKVIEDAGNKCQWCDSDTSPFSIHHPKGIDARDYDRIWYEIISGLINNLMKNDPSLAVIVESSFKRGQKRVLKQRLKAQKEKAKNNMVGVCPYCKGSKWNERKTLTPRYRCSSCKKEFDNFTKRIPKNLVRSIETLETKIKAQNYSHVFPSPNRSLNALLPFIYDEARESYEKTVRDLVSDYEEMNNVTVLCKKCHSAANMGLVICDKCKTNYRRIQYKTCFRCHKGKDKNSPFEEDWEGLEGELEEDFGKDWKKILQNYKNG